MCHIRINCFRQLPETVPILRHVKLPYSLVVAIIRKAEIILGIGSANKRRRYNAKICYHKISQNLSVNLQNNS